MKLRKTTAWTKPGLGVVLHPDDADAEAGVCPRSGRATASIQVWMAAQRSTPSRRTPRRPTGRSAFPGRILQCAPALRRESEDQHQGAWSQHDHAGHGAEVGEQLIEQGRAQPQPTVLARAGLGGPRSANRHRRVFEHGRGVAGDLPANRRAGAMTPRRRA